MLKGKPLVCVGVPSTGYWKSTMGMNALMLASVSVFHGILVDGIAWDGAYVEYNRNNIVRTVLEYPAEIDAIMWIDSDMRFPNTSLIELWNRGKDIIGCNYRERSAPYGHLGLHLDNDGARCLEPGLHRMSRMPGGLMLVKTPVYRKLPQPWYRAPVEEGEARDDYYFSEQARAAGFEVWCDNDLTRRVAHRGERDVPWYTEEPGAAVMAKTGALQNAA